MRRAVGVGDGVVSGEWFSDLAILGPQQDACGYPGHDGST